MPARPKAQRPASPAGRGLTRAAPRPAARNVAAETGSLRHVAVANRHPRLVIPRSAVARLIRTLDQNPAVLGLTDPAIPSGELSLVFLTDEALARLHANFLDDPTRTDVITFEGDPSAGLAGEICVSVDTAAREARDRGIEFATELTLYLVHGWLHLAGHDDLEPARKRRMRAAEKRALAHLVRHDAVPPFRLR